VLHSAPAVSGCFAVSTGWSRFGRAVGADARVLRALLWLLLCVAAFLAAIACCAWLLDGGLGAALRGTSGTSAARFSLAALEHDLAATGWAALSWAPIDGASFAGVLGAAAAAAALVLCATRAGARRARSYARLRVEPYRTDSADVQGLAAMYQSLHKRVLRRWWRRLLWGQPSLALEVHRSAPESDGASPGELDQVWLAVVCPAGLETLVEAAVRAAYPNCRLRSCRYEPAPPRAVVRLKKQAGFIKRVNTLERDDQLREPPMNRLMSVMAACREPVWVQLALTPTPALFERHAKRLYKRHEARLSRERREHLVMRDRSMVEDAELRGGLEVQHRPLFFTDLRVVASTRVACERIASELRTLGAENRLVERGTVVRNGLLGLYRRRVLRGEGNPLPSLHRGVFASTELALLWQLPSIEFDTVPFARTGVPQAPAPPSISRPRDGLGTLRDGLGAVTIDEQLRQQNTAVPGAVEQGKSSYLVATVAEDLHRRRCAVIVLDPKGDAADAAVSLVAPERTCTLLDLARPRCGFNPLAVDAPADVIADYVVAALKHLFTDADIRASSDRYLRNAIIAVLAYDRCANLWDAARLLSVGEEGYAYRNAVGARVRTMPAFKEISEFFTAELSAQLADARSTTTAKLDAPVNKLARLLNSPTIKRVLLNDSLLVDFDKLIANEEVLVVKGALGAMGAGNTSVVMQLLVGMLDAALARQQDLVAPERRVTVALKVDEAPLVLNRGFAETMALKRSAGLETVACWQSDAQWLDKDVREQLDALFAHRVYFATASARDARSSATLAMPEYSDTVRPEIEHLPALGRPDARLYLPKHHAIASWLTPHGRASAFVAQTIPLSVDHERLELHAIRQAERGGRHRSDLRQPHWDRPPRGSTRTPAGPENSAQPHWDRGQPGAAHEPAGRESEVQPHWDHRRPDRRPGPASTPPGCASESSSKAHRAGSGQQPTDDHPDETSPCGRSVAPTVGPSAQRTVDPPASYRELVELDRAHSVRWAHSSAHRRTGPIEVLDLEILALLAGFRHVLASQIHRRYNAERAMTTTQRRLKRLSDAGLVERFQFHRRDGGGVPMCYGITAQGLRVLQTDETSAPSRSAPPPASVTREPRRPQAGEPSAGAATHRRPVRGERHLQQARHDVHVAGCALALERSFAGNVVGLLGPDQSVVSPPSRVLDGGRVAIGPNDLRLPNGRAPHGFERTGADGQQLAVERFETVRPDAILQLAGTAWNAGVAFPAGAGRECEPTRARVGSPREQVSIWQPTRARVRSEPRHPDTGASTARTDVMLELDDRLAPGPVAAKLERYDHFVAGWSTHTRRYGPQRAVQPLVVFVCRDRARARECARRADAVLRACRAYAGEYPFDWEYPGRESIVFAAERDIHEGVAQAYGLSPLPPPVRVTAAREDPRAGRAIVEPRPLVPPIVPTTQGSARAREGA